MTIKSAIHNAIQINREKAEQEQAQRDAYFADDPRRRLEEAARRAEECRQSTELPANVAAREHQARMFESSEERAARQRAAIDAQNERARAVREVFATYDAQKQQAEDLARAAAQSRDAALRDGDIEAAVEAQQRALAAAALPAVIETLKKRRFPPSFPPELALAGRV